MNDHTDSQLLHAYAEHRSEPAFAELVRRHLDFVYSAALRMVCDSHLAEDVTQGVFIALAKSAAELTDRPVLSGWLHRTAQNIAAQTVRTDVRRRAREQEAAVMNELLSAEPDANWENIAPQLDDALGELIELDRDALLLRYFEGKSAREIAQTFGTSEEAAQKRVSRAVERLREFFSKRGVTVGASGLVVVISANAVQAAPVGLVGTITTAAALAGTTIAATATTTATKAIAMTTLQKTVIGATLVAAVGTGIYEGRQNLRLREQNQTFQRQQTPLTEQIQRLQKERDDASNKLAALQQENEQLRRDTTELAKLRGEVARLKAAQANAANDPTGSEMRSWLSRVQQLRQWLEQMPDKKIPELELLTDREWLEAARDARLDTEANARQALHYLRNLAKGKFAPTLQGALNKYVKANAGQFPTDLSQLKPYLESPVEDSLWHRYEIVVSSEVTNIGLEGNRYITEKAPVDDENGYDTRFVISTNSMTSFTPAESIPVGVGKTSFDADAMIPVISAFREAGNEKLADPSQLLPFVKTPQQQKALQQWIQRWPSLQKQRE